MLESLNIGGFIGEFGTSATSAFAVVAPFIAILLGIVLVLGIISALVQSFFGGVDMEYEGEYDNE